MKRKSAIYIRVSTNYQIDKDSLPLQRNDMVNYSKFVLGIEDYEVFEDAGFSGKNTIRPAFQDMIKRIKAGEFSHLLVWKIDRISRNLLDFCAMYDELKKYNCIFISKNEQFDTSSAMGEAMLKIILIFAELERKLTAERVAATMLDRATKGMWNGAPIPLGYKWDKEIKFPVIDPTEKLTIELIYNQYKEYESTAIVRNLLNESKVRTKKGGSWSTKTVSDIIRNPFYKGTYRYNFRESARGKKKNETEWILVEDNHPGIISKELWQKCNDIMDINAKRNNARFRSDAKTHIFASLIECGECGSNMYAKQDKPHKDGYIPTIYACKSRYNKDGCNQKTISDAIVGEFVLNIISNIIKINNNNLNDINDIKNKITSGPIFKEIKEIENLDLLLKYINFSKKDNFKVKNNKLKTKKINPNIENIENQLKRYVTALDKLEELYLFDDAEMSTQDYVVRKNNIENKIAELKEKLNKINNNENINYNIDFILSAATLELSKSIQEGNIKIKNLIQSIDRDIIKNFVNTIIHKIIVLDRKIQSIEFKNGLILKFMYKKKLH